MPTHDDFISFECPHCHKRRKARPEDAGKQARCSCGGRVVVPGQVIDYSTEVDSFSSFPAFDLAESQPINDDEPASEYWQNTRYRRRAQTSWLPYVMIGCLCLAVGIVCIIVLGRADPHVVATFLAVGFSVGAFILIATIVASVRQCGWWEGASYTIAGVFMGLAVIIAALASSSGKTRTTLRPQNSCGWCGHTWYPRGSHYSPRCPNCGRQR
jgi:predicted RNA-binding Zn-ribbon protein involved in translation (DUF1610 family)